VAANHPFDSQICSKFHKWIYSMSQHLNNNLSWFCDKMTATLADLTDLGFLWFREFYLETSRVIQVFLSSCLEISDHIPEHSGSWSFFNEF
jgi:hypothetical protein